MGRRRFTDTPRGEDTIDHGFTGRYGVQSGNGVLPKQGLADTRFGENHKIAWLWDKGPQDVVVGSWYRIPDSQ